MSASSYESVGFFPRGRCLSYQVKFQGKLSQGGTRSEVVAILLPTGTPGGGTLLEQNMKILLKILM